MATTVDVRTAPRASPTMTPHCTLGDPRAATPTLLTLTCFYYHVHVVLAKTASSRKLHSTSVHKLTAPRDNLRTGFRRAMLS